METEAALFLFYSDKNFLFAVAEIRYMYTAYRCSLRPHCTYLPYAKLHFLCALWYPFGIFKGSRRDECVSRPCDPWTCDKGLEICIPTPGSRGHFYTDMQTTRCLGYNNRGNCNKIRTLWYGNNNSNNETGFIVADVIWNTKTCYQRW